MRIERRFGAVLTKWLWCAIMEVWGDGAWSLRSGSGSGSGAWSLEFGAWVFGPMGFGVVGFESGGLGSKLGSKWRY